MNDSSSIAVIVRATSEERSRHSERLFEQRAIVTCDARIMCGSIRMPSFGKTVNASMFRPVHIRSAQRQGR